jgi:hypothetical protein
MSAHVITLRAAHCDDATRPLLGVPRAVLAVASGPAAVADSPWLTPGAYASDEHTENTLSGAASDVARAGRSRGPGIRGGYSRSAVRRRGSATATGAL